MSIMKSIYKLLTILALCMLAAACVKEKGATDAPSFQIDLETYGSIILEQNKQVSFIPVTSNVSESEWKIETTASWCRASRSISAEKGIMIAVEDNTDKEDMRQAQVLASAAGTTYKIIVSQFGYGPAIVVSNVSVGPEGGEVYMDVVANVPLNESLITKPQFDPEDGEDWIRFVGIEGESKAFGSSTFIFSVTTNELPDKRMATVPVRARLAADSSADTQCVITQNSINIDSPAIFSDNKVLPTGVKASQVSAYEGPAENLIDGSYETYYHSPYEVTTNFPVTWEFTFDGENRIDYINVMHRGTTSGGIFNPGSHWRGQIGTFNVYAKQKETDPYVLVQTFDFGGNGGYQTAWLDEPIVNPAVIKFEILDDADPNHVSYTDGQYVTCGEVEFFNTNRSDVNEWINKIFTDLSCSALKEGVTKKDIIQMNSVSPYLAANVAIPLYNGTYDENEKDFRIHSYEPYSDSHVNKALVTQYYTSMNNPTGIEVKIGDDILVCVDDIPDGQTVSIAVYGEDGEYGPNYGGASESENVNQNTALQKGINTIRITADGMAYIMNTVPPENRQDLASFKPVKVHILPGCGKVQGYFDPARHSDERYKEILVGCTYKYFMVKGQKCMFLFHTSQLKADFPNSIRGGIEAWDNLVAWEHELMGLDKVNWFNNHMVAVTNTNPEVYMNATNRRVQFNASTINWICDPESLLVAGEGAGVCNIWGPAHEMGHMNQMAINWRSCTESSNNLFSNYANFKLAGNEFYKTRWSRGETLDKLARDYANKTPWALLGDGSYQNEDPGLHMRMNWQLWNYYHNCGVKPDFFPALFDYFRDGHQMPNQAAPSYYGRAEDAGLCQLEYYEACCIVAGEDLTEFFDTWGFFRTIDQMYSQYGDTRYTVTDAMINTSKSRIREMGLPKAAPIQYLEDRAKFGGTTYSEMGYYTQFKEKKAITKKPSCTVNGSKVILSNCDEAVAVEVRRGTADTGELLYFSNLFTFNIPSGVSLSNASLWAVQADGTRVAVQK